MKEKLLSFYCVVLKDTKTKFKALTFDNAICIFHLCQLQEYRNNCNFYQIEMLSRGGERGILGEMTRSLYLQYFILSMLNHRLTSGQNVYQFRFLLSQICTPTLRRIRGNHKESRASLACLYKKFRSILQATTHKC